MAKINRQFLINMGRGLGAKFLLAFVFFILLPSFIMGFWYYRQSVSETRDELLDTAVSNLDHLENLVSGTLENAVSVTNLILVNDEIDRILNRMDRSTTWGEQYDDLQVLAKVLEQYNTNTSVYRMRVYLSPDQFYSNQNVMFCDITALMDNGIYDRLLGEGSGKAWQLRKNHQDTPFVEPVSQIAYYVILRALVTSGKVNTIVFEVDIRESLLREVTRQYYLYDESSLYIVDAQGRIISAEDPELLDTNLYDELGLDAIPSAGLNRQEAGRYLIKKELSINDWSLVVEGSVDALSSSGTLPGTAMIILIVEIILAFFVTTVFFLRLDRRLHILADRMGSIDEYEKMPSLPEKSGDEIGRLTRYFNAMVGRIRDMINDVRRISDEKRSADIDLLLSQINPHFIYNALESINWKAIDREAFEVSKAITQLSRFLRLSLGKGAQTAPIRQEMEQIELYLGIQKDLINRPLTWEFQVDEAVAGYEMPRLVLQPLIENAIVHGILEKKDGTARIRIISSIRNDRIEFTIWDSGMGMSADKIADINAQMASSSASQYFALYNVNQRLVMHCGRESALHIDSAPGEYTRIDFSIPLPIK